MSRWGRGKPDPAADLPPVGVRAPAAGLTTADPAPPLREGQYRALMRLELLRLSHRHDHSSEQVIERAKAFEAYVLDQAADKF